ncbi:hypothetical protein [Burkholderia sp. Bp8963]|uniref:hypothetical protein n=1 Tax=Burkholderia sp. Bp8963 TaxID=2184547 RepID=UPI000F5967E6|nr:hypothetical protein [Burkholderia sp. Bp8963]
MEVIMATGSNIQVTVADLDALGQRLETLGSTLSEGETHASALLIERGKVANFDTRGKGLVTFVTTVSRQLRTSNQEATS